MKKHKRLPVFQWKYTKTPMSKFECFGHAVKGQSYLSWRVGFKRNVKKRNVILSKYTDYGYYQNTNIRFYFVKWYYFSYLFKKK